MFCYLKLFLLINLLCQLVMLIYNLLVPIMLKELFIRRQINFQVHYKNHTFNNFVKLYNLFLMSPLFDIHWKNE